MWNREASNCYRSGPQLSTCGANRLRGGGRGGNSPNCYQAAEAEKEQGADGEGAAVRVLREEVKGGRSDGRAGEIAQSDSSLVNATMLTFRLADVHRIKEG